MGAVYLAIEENLGRRVAIKVLKENYGDTSPERCPSSSARPRAWRRSSTRTWFASMRSVKQERSENPRPYLAMGVRRRCDARRTDREQTAVSSRSRLCESSAESAQALRAAWRKRIVHRDVKPGNIFLDLEDRVRVGDFGIAKPLEMAAGHYTASGVTLGTPLYLAPEQALERGSRFQSRSCTRSESCSGSHWSVIRPSRTRTRCS